MPKQYSSKLPLLISCIATGILASFMVMYLMSINEPKEDIDTIDTLSEFEYVIDDTSTEPLQKITDERTSCQYIIAKSATSGEITAITPILKPNGLPKCR